jgi:hypothetical protein
LSGKPRKKPRGKIGIVQLGTAPKFRELTLPVDKAGIERAILWAALGASHAPGMDPYQLVAAPKQNQENHFDFTLITERGEEYLDLMEAAPQAIWR